MTLFQSLKRGIPLKARLAVGIRFQQGALHDVAGLRTVSLPTHGFQLCFVPQEHGDAVVEPRNVRHSGLDFSGDVESHGHDGET